MFNGQVIAEATFGGSLSVTNGTLEAVFSMIMIGFLDTFGFFTMNDGAKFQSYMNIRFGTKFVVDVGVTVLGYVNPLAGAIVSAIDYGLDLFTSRGSIADRAGRTVASLIVN